MKTPEMKLRGYRSLFTESTKRLIKLPLNQLHQHSRLHIQVRENEYLKDLTDSIQKNGIFEDIRAVADPNGGYIIVSGRHRCKAAEKAGLTEVPCIIDDEMTMEQAEIAISDCNLKHELSPMEKAWAFRIKREAENRQGFRTDLHGEADKPEERVQESERTMQRYIRLTYLIPELQQLTEKDKKPLPVRTGEALSFFPEDLQHIFYELLMETQHMPRAAELASLKEKNATNSLEENDIRELFTLTQKQAPRYKLSLTSERLREWVPVKYTAEQTAELVLNLLQEWAEKEK